MVSSFPIHRIIEGWPYALRSRRGTPSKEDRREKLVELTAKGHELIAGIFPQHASDIADLLSSLSTKEQDELARLCRKLGLSLIEI